MKKLGNKIGNFGQLQAPFNLEYEDTVISDDIPLLPKTVRDTIKRAIEERLTLDPIGFGKPLRYSLKGLRRLRVGDYRVIYQLKNKTVIIIAIKHRKDVYENA